MAEHSAAAMKDSVATTEDSPARKTRMWAGLAVVLIAALGLGVIAFNRPSLLAGSAATSASIASSAEVERYAALVQGAQKNLFAASKSYASTLEQLKLEPPRPGVTIDYRGSSPLGFCWLARAGNGVWYTISQNRVARSSQTVDAAPPTSCP